MLEIAEKLDSPNDVISGVCLTDEGSRWDNGSQREHILYLEYTRHSWRTHCVDYHVFRGLSWMGLLNSLD